MTTRLMAHAEKQLIALIDRVKADGGYRLPTTLQLSQLLAMSPQTVTRALKRFQDRGEIIGVPRKGLLLASPEKPNDLKSAIKKSASVAREKKWETVRRQVIEDISAGILGRDTPLPTYKNLSNRYNVNYRTLRRALAGVDTSLLTGQFINRNKTINHVTPAIVFIVPIEKNREAPNRHLWSACYRRGVQPVFEPMFCNEHGPVSGEDLGIDRYAMREDVAGFCYWAGHRTDDEELVNMLGNTGKPVALIDDTGITFADENVQYAPRIKIFQVGTGLLAPRAVAYYLIAMGHHHIAYISYSHNTLWACIRGAEIKRVIADAGSAFSCVSFTASGSAAQAGSVRVFKNMLHDLSYFGPLLGEAVNAVSMDFAKNIEQHISELDNPLQQLFEKVYADKRITAWVCDNDFSGVEAIRYLRARKCGVGSDISVIGFDDSDEASAIGLTSYNFNFEAIMATAVDYVLDPASRGKPWKSVRSFELKGEIVERGSSGVCG